MKAARHDQQGLLPASSISLVLQRLAATSVEPTFR
jgi:hypothetical protein